MAIYINAAQAISPQNTFKTDGFLEKIETYTKRFNCIDPEYKEFFSPIMIRRMSTIIKRSSATAMECVKESGIEMPDAINTGTGMGCLEDTEKFLNQMLDNDENLMAPTSFIQSTHNTLGSTIALALKCKNHNLVYVHGNLSFESALLDTILFIKEGKGKNILLGGIDELTDENYELKTHINLWKGEDAKGENILNSTTNGCIPGEGANFFMIGSEKSSSTYAELKGMDMFYKADSSEHVEDRLNRFLKANNVPKQDIDLVFMGVNGHAENDQYYYEIKDKIFNHMACAYFKHLCGEYDTASSFCTWLTANILKNQIVPDVVLMDNHKPKKLKNILIYNQENFKNHSFILISAC